MTRVTDKIDNAYLLYVLSKQNIHQACLFTKISRPTMIKYITIKERLDLTLFEDLNKKGKDKLTIGFALDLCKYVLNPEIQVLYYSDLMKYPNRERKSELMTMNTCLICADTNVNLELLPCCNTSICECCLITMLDTAINDLAFLPIRCPFCNVSFPYNFLEWFLYEFGVTLDSWRRSKEYNRSKRHNEIYCKNLFYRYHTLLRFIAIRQKYEGSLEHVGQKLLSEGDKYFGSCTRCSSPPISERRIQRKMFRKMKICSVEKSCVNDENDIAILEPNMFLCKQCQDQAEDPNNLLIRQCPHCGVKTLRPHECNYVQCGDHAWCFVCNERLEMGHNGHNVHYWMGPGTSPYINKCRKSEDYDSPTFILNTCYCNSCKGLPSLCKTLDCLNRTIDEYCSDCIACDNVD